MLYIHCKLDNQLISVRHILIIYNQMPALLIGLCEFVVTEVDYHVLNTSNIMIGSGGSNLFTSNVSLFLPYICDGH